MAFDAHARTVWDATLASKLTTCAACGRSAQCDRAPSDGPHFCAYCWGEEHMADAPAPRWHWWRDDAAALAWLRAARPTLTVATRAIDGVDQATYRRRDPNHFFFTPPPLSSVSVRLRR